VPCYVDEDFTFFSNLKIEKRFEDSIIPTRGSNMAAGLDLYAHDPATIKPGETVKIDTGISIELPACTFGAIFARSGLATKQGLRPANCVGVVDADYRGAVIVALHNDSNETREIAKGDRIAQLVIIPYIIPHITEDKLNNTERGDGGFGSTGTN
jgi:dUTP pyrophosphatase